MTNENPYVTKLRERERVEKANCDACCGDLSKCPNLSKGKRVFANNVRGVIYETYTRCFLLDKADWELMVDTGLGRSGLGEHQRFKSRTLERYEETPDNAEAKHAVERYVKEGLPNGKWLVLIGPVGTGKTHLAVATMIESIRYMLHPKFSTSSKMLMDYRTSYQDRTSAKVIDEFMDADMLVIDDLGKEMVGTDKDKSTLEFMQMILNQRYETNRATVITTNLTKKQIADTYGEAIESRLAELGTYVTVKGADYRKLAAERMGR